MSAEIIDGKTISKRIREEIAERAAALSRRGVQPGLGVILVGEDPASASYVRSKQRACEKAGIYSVDRKLPDTISEEELLREVHGMNEDPAIHGILVQLPLPAHIDTQRVIERIDPSKDVDGFHPASLGRLLAGNPGFTPCTPQGIVELLDRSGVSIPGSHVVIVGRSNIVGKPLAAMLVQKHSRANATVTVAHSKTKDLTALTSQADILIAAAGQVNLITADMVAEGVVVIDVGMNRVDDPEAKKGYRLVGDVDFDGVKEKASKITPVPGGVGPMTIAMLLQNTVESANRAAEASEHTRNG
jgi:methylenetetrahydrofolate dehydrogenase (NADP+)/methenyltetrahydrofolate cyclohydrolase